MSSRSCYATSKQSVTLRKHAAFIALAASALLGIPSTLRAQQRQPHDPAAAKAAQKQLSLRNTTPDTITLELRLGTAPDCAANATAATQSIPPGREWLIASPRPICWRRADAKAAPGLSNWHRHVLKSGEHLKLTI